MNLADELDQSLVFQSAWARTSAAFLPVIVAAGRDIEVGAKAMNGIVGFHRVDPFKPVEGGSERIPNVFFKMSRCSRKWRFSRKAWSSWDCRSEWERGFAPAAALPPASAGAKRLFQA